MMDLLKNSSSEESLYKINRTASVIIKQVDGTFYFGYCKKGIQSTDVKGWAIKKVTPVTLGNGDKKTLTTWASGNSDLYAHIFDSYLEYTYNLDGNYTIVPSVIKPVVSGQVIENVTETTAGATATVNPGNGETVVTIQYGKSGLFDLSVPAVQSPVSGGNPVAVSADLIDLDSDTDYNFRVLAVNSAGTTFSIVVYFKTEKIIDLPVVTDTVIRHITGITAHLEANVTPGNDSTVVTVEYGEGIDFDHEIEVPESPLTGTDPVAVALDIINLVPGSTYHARVKAVNAAGPVTGDAVVFETSEAANAPGITNIVAMFPDEGRIVNTAAVVADVKPEGLETTVKVEWGKTTAYGNEQVLDVIEAGYEVAYPAHVIRGLKPGKYYCRFTATNALGTTVSDDYKFRIYPGVGRDGVDYETALNNAVNSMTGNIYYIDPESVDEIQDGTIEHPYHSWTAFANLGGSNHYLQKRGTTYNTLLPVLRTQNGPCVIGVYGEGDEQAYMTTVSTTISTFITGIHRLVMFDIDIEGYRTGGIGTEIGRGLRLSAPAIGLTMDHFIYNVTLHRFNVAFDTALTNGYFYGFKMVHSEMYETFIEGAYPTGATNFEFAFNYIHDVNNAYFINEDQNTSRGDCMQIGFVNTDFEQIHLLGYVHHNTFDRTSSGNKFCLIWNEYWNTETMHVYNNHFICPDVDTFPGHGVSSLYCCYPYQGNKTPEYTYIYNNIFQGGANGISNYTRSGSFVHHNQFVGQDVAIASGAGINQHYYNNIFKDYKTVAVGIANNARISSMNNVFDSSVAGSYAYSGVGAAELVAVDYNSYFRGRIASSAYALAEWRAENPGRDLNSDELIDPLFSDPINGDFRITALSPLSGSGENVGLVNDFSNQPNVIPVSKALYDR